eukprot:13969716-Alexandrium_andersonii.AAC.1
MCIRDSTAEACVGRPPAADPPPPQKSRGPDGGAGDRLVEPLKAASSGRMRCCPSAVVQVAEPEPRGRRRSSGEEREAYVWG